MFLTTFDILSITIYVNLWKSVHGSLRHGSFDLHQNQSAFVRTHHFNTTRVTAVVLNWILFPFHNVTEEPMTIIILMSNAVIGIRAFHDINQSWSFVLIQLLYDCSCGSRDVWVLCIFPKWNSPASPGKQPHLVQFLTFTVKLLSVVINDKRTTSVVLTTVIN